MEGETINEMLKYYSSSLIIKMMYINILQLKK